jgi:flagellar assembly factor FliW
MPVVFLSSRFGAVEVEAEQIIEFPLGLIGLRGTHYALIDRNPGTGFQWLHALEDPSLALPVVRPQQFFASFALQISDEDRERTGIEHLDGAGVYVTVRASSTPLQLTANLRAPLVIRSGTGFQVINTDESAPLKAPLFTLPPIGS